MTLFNSDNSNPDNQDIKVDEVIARFKKDDGSLDVEAVAKKIYHADRTIEAREQKLDELQEDLKVRLSLEQIMEKISSKQSTVSNPEHTDSDEQGDKGKEKAVPSKEEIASLVKETLTLETQKSAQERNVAQVTAELKKAWGDSYVSKLKARALELEMTEQEMTSLAALRPKAFLDLVGAKPTKAPDFAPPRSTGVANQSSKTGEPTKYSEFKKLRKENPSLYYSPRIHNRMMELVAEHGEDFYKT